MLFHPMFQFSICPLPGDGERIACFTRVQIENCSCCINCQVRPTVVIPICLALEGLGIAWKHVIGRSLRSCKLTTRKGMLSSSSQYPTGQILPLESLPKADIGARITLVVS